jgi:hypothetical protein
MASAGRAGAGLRWAGIAGVVVVVLSVGMLFLPVLPGGTSSADLAAQLRPHAAAHQTTVVVRLLSDIAFLTFLAGVWSRLRQSEGAGGMLAMLFLIGGVLSEALYVASTGLYMAAVQFGLNGVPSREGLPGLSVLDGWVNVAGRPAQIVQYLAAAAVILGTRVFPRWLGWVALAVAALTLVSTIGMFVPDPVAGVVRVVDWLGFGLGLCWILAVGVLMMVRPRSGRSGSAR